MEPGSIQEVFERLKSWCALRDRGLARVEWDSAYARQEVVNRLKRWLGGVGVSLTEIGLQPGEAAENTVTELMGKLRSASGSVVSITGIEWAFPERGSRLDTLVTLSFQRETLASLPVQQIWWVPSTLTERFVLGVPDLNSWFRLRLHLTEVPPRSADAVRGIELTGRKTVSVTEARALERRFWERLPVARAQNMPEKRIWTELAQPAVEALQSAGLILEAEAIVELMPNARGSLEREIQEISAARGPEDPEVIALTARLARLLGSQGDFEGARKIEERVLEASQLAFGREHRETVAAMNNLAVTLSKSGDYAAARLLEERVVEASRRVLGEEHPDTLTAMSVLSSTLHAQGDLAGSRRLQEQVLAARRSVLGEEHPDTLSAIEHLARTLYSQGDLGGARQLYQRVVEASRRVLGEEHPNTLVSMYNLAVILLEAGDLDEALRLLRQCLLSQRKVLGDSHPDTEATAEFLSGLETQPHISRPGG